MNFIKRLSSVHLSIRFILHTDDETDGFFKNSRQKKRKKKGSPEFSGQSSYPRLCAIYSGPNGLTLNIYYIIHI